MRRLLVLSLLVAGVLVHPQRAPAQVLAAPILRGRAFVGDSALRGGVVILHRVAADTQGEVDSAAVAPDGTFSIPLPSVPDPVRSEVYFASVRHAGVLYFGEAITLPVQLDSLYEIHTYDTLLVAPEGREVTVQARNLFLEQGEGDRWLVTDLFELRNDEARTLVAREGGIVWRFPLPPGAADAEVSRAGFAWDAAEVRGGDVVVSAPLPPGERLFVVRYTLPDPFLELPLPERTEILEILVREPAPPLVAPLLAAGDRVELEPGATFRRFTGGGFSGAVVRLEPGREATLPPVRWLTVVLAMALAGVAVWAVRSGRARPRAMPGADRRSVILEIARLDEAFDADPAHTSEERGAYEARRRDLLRRLRSLG